MPDVMIVDSTGEAIYPTKQARASGGQLQAFLITGKRLSEWPSVLPRIPALAQSILQNPSTAQRGSRIETSEQRSWHLAEAGEACAPSHYIPPSYSICTAGVRANISYAFRLVNQLSCFVPHST